MGYPHACAEVPTCWISLRRFALIAILTNRLDKVKLNSVASGHCLSKDSKKYLVAGFTVRRLRCEAAMEREEKGYKGGRAPYEPATLKLNNPSNREKTRFYSS